MTEWMNFFAEVPQNIEYLPVNEEKTFRFFETWIPRF